MLRSRKKILAVTGGSIAAITIFGVGAWAISERTRVAPSDSAIVAAAKGLTAYLGDNGSVDLNTSSFNDWMLYSMPKIAVVTQNSAINGYTLDFYSQDFVKPTNTMSTSGGGTNGARSNSDIPVTYLASDVIQRQILYSLNISGDFASTDLIASRIWNSNLDTTPTLINSKIENTDNNPTSIINNFSSLVRSKDENNVSTETITFNNGENIENPESGGTIVRYQKSNGQSDKTIDSISVVSNTGQTLWRRDIEKPTGFNFTQDFKITYSSSFVPDVTTTSNGARVGTQEDGNSSVAVQGLVVNYKYHSNSNALDKIAYYDITYTFNGQEFTQEMPNRVNEYRRSLGWLNGLGNGIIQMGVAYKYIPFF